MKTVSRTYLCLALIMSTYFHATCHGIEFTESFSGSIIENTTWTGNINITGDVIVEAGSVLTILPGTKVYINPKIDDQMSGINVNLIEIIIKGKIVSSGLPGNKILFLSSGNTPSNRDWQGLKIEGEARIEYCETQNADLGIFVVSDIHLASSTFLNNSRDLGFFDAGGRVEGCSFSSELSISQSHGIIITDSSFENYGIIFDGTYASGDTYLHNCKITNCNNGIWLYDNRDHQNL